MFNKLYVFPQLLSTAQDSTRAITLLNILLPPKPCLNQWLFVKMQQNDVWLRIIISGEKIQTSKLFHLLSLKEWPCLKAFFSCNNLNNTASATDFRPWCFDSDRTAGACRSCPITPILSWTAERCYNKMLICPDKGRERSLTSYCHWQNSAWGDKFNLLQITSE